MLVPTDRVRLILRRFIGDCSKGPMSCHEASVPFGEHPVRLSSEGYLESYQDLAPTRDDPRWPTHCEQCGIALPGDTVWQVFQERIYRRTDTGEEHLLRDAPPGAMYIATWFHEKDHLHVCLPPNGGHDYWDVDGPSSNGNGWTRTGEPPNVTANPSILTPRYHGFLRNGWLEEC
jgi:hypothetical protein